MKTHFKELIPIIKIVKDNKHPDLLAYVSLKFVDEHERHFISTGYTIRKSQFDGKPYLAAPAKKTGNGFFKFTLVESSLWREIEKEVISQYEKETIPVIE